MQTIIIQDHRRQSYFHNLAMSNNGIVKGVNLISLTSLFKPKTQGMHKEALLLSCAKLLQENQSKFPIYAPMFHYPNFINEILTFAKELALYNVPIDELPVDTNANIELKNILALLLTLDLSEKKQYAMIDSVKNQLLHTSDLHIYERFDQSYFYHAFLNDLLSIRKDLSIQYEYDCNQTQSLHYALSVRKELEAIAQDIVTKNTSCNIVLCSYGEQYPVLKQVFARYKIPYSSIQLPLSLHANTILVNLAYTALFKTSDALTTAIATDCFSKSISSDLLEFINTVMVQPGIIPSFDDLNDEMFKREKDHYLDMSQRAKEYFASIQDELDLLLQSTHPKDAIMNAYSIFQTNKYLNNKDELKQAKAIRLALNDAIPLIETQEDAIFLLRRIDQMHLSKDNYQTDFCMVTDLQHPVDHKETTYIVGCNSQSYPGMPLRNGLFDEGYTKNIKTLPSLEQRHTLYMSQLEWIKHSANNLYYSYATNDYQGKEIQLAFHVETMFKNDDGDLVASPWPLKVLEPYKPSNHVLNKDLAKELFFKDGKISSSISRVERYFNCPFSYFIQSGLNVSEFFYADLDAATAGKIQHAFMEQIVNAKGKKYVYTTKEEIEEIITPYFNDLIKLLPKLTLELNFTKRRMVDSLYDALIFLKAYEEATLFKTTSTELWFDIEMTPLVSMHGIIDRIDTFNDQIHVVDYKSSTKRLSEKEVKKGLQLQLLTYLIAASETQGKNAGGAYYYSLGNPSTKVDAGSFKTKGITLNEINEDTMRESYLQERRLKGWTFDIDDLDDDEFKSFIQPKRTAKSMYDYDLIKDCMESLYTCFTDDLKEGTIKVEPVEGACTFCKYKGICKFKGLAVAGEERYMKGERMKGETL